VLGHLGCFCNLAIVNSAAINMDVQVLPEEQNYGGFHAIKKRKKRIIWSYGHKKNTSI
jgi:hypothetical protein